MTIREFAMALGVSPTTVSRAIHGRGRISPATRARILARMPELDFTPNINAQRLSHGRTNMVALDFGVWHDFLSDPFFVEITREVQEALEARGYGVVLSGSGQVLDRWVRTRAVDGVLLVGDATVRDEAREIARTGAVCVAIANHAYRGIPGVGSVYVDLDPGARQVAQLLVQSGHQRIGFIGSVSPDETLFAFREELQRLGAPLAEERVLLGWRTPQEGAVAMERLMALREPPTAVFARTDGFAFSAMRAAHRQGRRIPQDLSIVGHDDVPFSALVEPPLTTVKVDCVALARLAADRLFALLDDPQVVIEPQGVETALVLRESVAPPGAR